MSRGKNTPDKQRIRDLLTEVARIRIYGAYTPDFVAKAPPGHPYSKALEKKYMLIIDHEREKISDEKFLAKMTDIERELLEISKKIEKAGVY